MQRQLSLPPGVDGVAKGELQFVLGGLHWDLAGSPKYTRLRVRWWGADERDDIILQSSPQKDAGFVLEVRCGPSHFSRYLTDMSTLDVLVEDCVKARVIGTAAVDVRTLDVAREVSGSFPILATGNGRCLGKLEVSVRVHFGNITSFELAEHRAGTDSTLPTYPAGVSRAVTRLALEPHARGAAALAEELQVQELFTQLEASSTKPAGNSHSQRPPADDELCERFDFFLLLNQAFKRRKWAVLEAFKALDANRTGALDVREAAQLCRKILPFPPTAAQMRYFSMMLAPSGAEDFTFAALQAAVDECLAIGAKLRSAAAQPEVARRLQYIASEVQQRSLEFGKLFHESPDRDATGAMPVASALSLIKQLVPSMGKEDARFLIGKLVLGTNASATVSLGDLKTLFRSIINDLSVAPARAHPAGAEAQPSKIPRPSAHASSRISKRESLPPRFADAATSLQSSARVPPHKVALVRSSFGNNTDPGRGAQTSSGVPGIQEAVQTAVALSAKYGLPPPPDLQPAATSPAGPPPADAAHEDKDSRALARPEPAACPSPPETSAAPAPATESPQQADRAAPAHLEVTQNAHARGQRVGTQTASAAGFRINEPPGALQRDCQQAPELDARPQMPPTATESTAPHNDGAISHETTALQNRGGPPSQPAAAAPAVDEAFAGLLSHAQQLRDIVTSLASGAGAPRSAPSPGHPLPALGSIQPVRSAAASAFEAPFAFPWAVGAPTPSPNAATSVPQEELELLFMRLLAQSAAHELAAPQAAEASTPPKPSGGPEVARQDENDPLCGNRPEPEQTARLASPDAKRDPQRAATPPAADASDANAGGMEDDAACVDAEIVVDAVDEVYFDEAATLEVLGRGGAWRPGLWAVVKSHSRASSAWVLLSDAEGLRARCMRLPDGSSVFAGLSHPINAQVRLRLAEGDATAVLGYQRALLLELWLTERPLTHESGALGRARVVGLASIPLQPAAQHDGSQLLARGRFQIRDILRGRDNGCVALSVAVGTPTMTPDADAGIPAANESCGAVDGVGHELALAPTPAAGIEALGAVPEGRSPRVESVQHTFTVKVNRAQHLATKEDVTFAQLPVPTSRYIRYFFPGETEPLYTNDAPIERSSSFDASARHCIQLPAATSALEPLNAVTLEALDARDDAPPHPDGDLPMLVFELWSVLPDDSELCVAVGALTVGDIMATLDFDPAAWLEALERGERDAPVAAASTREFCLDLAALGGEHEGLLLDASRPAQLLVEVGYDVQAVIGSAEAEPRRAALAHAAPTPQRSAGEAVRGTLCVEVIRACGLQSAVQEAHTWLGSGAGVLSHALQLGPHAFATLSLFPGSPALQTRMPALETSFQAQTGAPEWGYRRLLDLTLDAAAVSALATGDLCLEVWHHCPRSLAVATALSQGLPSHAPGDARRHVLLGSASHPLRALLTRRQGLHAWLPVSSRSGKVVGAVQLALYFTQLAGVSWPSSSEALGPVHRFPEVAASLPPPLSWLAAPPHDGFGGQWARLTLLVEALHLPHEPRWLHSAQSRYRVELALPCSPLVIATPVAQPARNPAVDADRSWTALTFEHSAAVWLRADSAAVSALAAHPLAVKLHRSGPTDTPRPVNNNNMRGQRVAAPPSAMAVFAVAEVDLFPLLVRGGLAASCGDAAAPACRWLSGRFLLVQPAAKRMPPLRLQLRALLELRPPGQQAPNASDAVWHIAPLVAAHDGANAAAASERAQRDVALMQRLPRHTAVAPALDVPALGASERADVPLLRPVPSPPRDDCAGGHSAAGERCLADHVALEHNRANQPDTRDTDPDPQSRRPSSQTLLSARDLRDETSVSAITIDPPRGRSGSPEAATAGLAAGSPGSSREPSSTPRTSNGRYRQQQDDTGCADTPASSLSSDDDVRLGTPPRPGPSESPEIRRFGVSRKLDASLPRLRAASPPRAAPPLQDGADCACVTVSVEKALHLPAALSSALDNVGDAPDPARTEPSNTGAPQRPPRLYVRYRWPDAGGALVATPSAQPYASTGGRSAAYWNHNAHLAVKASALAHGVAPLRLDVCVACGEDLPGAFERERGVLPHLRASRMSIGDEVVGRVDVDMSALVLLRELSGWYNIVDTGGNHQGQLKLSISLCEPIPAALQRQRNASTVCAEDEGLL